MLGAILIAAAASAIPPPADKTAIFTAAGFVRRSLQAAGFTVERRKGFAGKREMLCGVKGRITPRFR